MAYSNQLMNFSETKDYAGFVMRRASDREIDLVLQYEVEGVIRGMEALSRCKWSEEEKKQYGIKFIRQNLQIARETAMVYEFTLIKIKIFVYHNICINDYETDDMDINQQMIQFVPYRYIIDGDAIVRDFFNEDTEFEI